MGAGRAGVKRARPPGAVLAEHKETRIVVEHDLVFSRPDSALDDRGCHNGPHYSMAIVETSKGTTVTLPETGDGLTCLMCLDEIQFVSALLRIDAKTEDAEIFAEIHRLQDEVKLTSIAKPLFEAIAQDDGTFAACFECEGGASNNLQT